MKSGFLPQELIRRKRDGGALSQAEIADLVAGITDRRLSDAQVGALAMAILWRGLSRDETVALTGAMADSGARMRWSLDRPVVDKHSTGGVGDKVSLVLAPLLAACGAAVPMVSGRGLGHTGGTLDKLSAIPGYDFAPDMTLFESVVRRVGCAIVGQTDDLAPADRRLYAIRDVTATVESTPLITASILSKKMAAGIGALVMDVKIGSGAFMPDLDSGRALARSIVAVGTGAGMTVTALLTDMNQVLGRTAGNAVEVREAIEFLTNRQCDQRLKDVTFALACQMLVATGIDTEVAMARRRAAAAIASGAAAACFAEMVAMLGGQRDLVERVETCLPRAPIVVAVLPGRRGQVTAIDVRAVGLAVLALGGGRTRPDDAIDPAVGLTEIAGVGEEVGPDRPLALCHARSEEAAAMAGEQLRAAFSLAGSVARPAPPVLEVISS